MQFLTNSHEEYFKWNIQLIRDAQHFCVNIESPLKVFCVFKAYFDVNIQLLLYYLRSTVIIQIPDI